MILAAIPALPLHTAGKYVAGAYVVLFAIVLIYVAIMAIRLSRIEAELGELLNMSASSPALSPEGEGERPPASSPASSPEGEGKPSSASGEPDQQPESTLA